MNLAMVILAILSIAAARPQQNLSGASILNYVFNNLGFGGFFFDVETSDGFKHQQQGEIRNAGRGNKYLAVKGLYSYLGPDGKTYTVDYLADENGFQPAGKHIPPAAGVRKLGIAMAEPMPEAMPEPMPDPLSSAAQASIAGGGLG